MSWHRQPSFFLFFFYLFYFFYLGNFTRCQSTMKSKHRSFWSSLLINIDPKLQDATKSVNPSYKLVMLNVLMPCSTVVFKFNQILHRIFFVVLINCNKMDYVQNLLIFKIQDALQYWKFLKACTLFSNLQLFYMNCFCCTSQLLQDRLYTKFA